MKRSGKKVVIAVCAALAIRTITMLIDRATGVPDSGLGLHDLLVALGGYVIAAIILSK